MALKPGMATIDCADLLDEREVPGLRWMVLADPEGNEFCVAG